MGGWVSMSVKLFFRWSEVVVSFGWASYVIGCIRYSVSCAEKLVSVMILFRLVGAVKLFELAQ